MFRNCIEFVVEAPADDMCILLPNRSRPKDTYDRLNVYDVFCVCVSIEHCLFKVFILMCRSVFISVVCIVFTEHMPGPSMPTGIKA